MEDLRHTSPPLTVYKASAGSGKTFTLAIEYISLLIHNPKNYERILAVTFTNKATEEMKMRIIGQLYGIWKELPDSKDYMDKIIEKTGKNKDTIVKNAGIALSLLIHHYNQFRVQTIDAFFQSVLRNLARELDLTPSLRIDLNDRQVEEAAVDNLILELTPGNPLMHWLLDYINHNIQEDQSWNVIGEIKKFGLNIFRDFYKKHEMELNRLMQSNKFFDTYISRLRGQRQRIQEEYAKDIKELTNLFQNSGYDNPEYYKYANQGSIYKFIHSIQDCPINNNPLPGRVLTFIDDPNKMTQNVVDKQEFLNFANQTLIPHLNSFIEKRTGLWCEYQSISLTLSHLSQLRLLHAIAAKVDELNMTANRFQLSNTQSLLSSLIADSDSPFIFEKIGAQLKHIMIDEFQDTSTLQWKNFKVLLDNCLSNSGSHDLIVGDVKQSIYRWRAGDWKLLNDIEHDFHQEQLKVEPLDTNYRSEQKIIEFNNVFFEEAVKKTVTELEKDNIKNHQQLTKAYADTSQKIKKSNKKGYVRIELYPNTDYQDTIMTRLLESIDELLEKGVALHDIAILVRANNDIQAIATLLMRERPEINLISDEAFRLDASLAVNILIDTLRILVQPDDLVTLARLTKAYHQHVLNDMDDMDDVVNLIVTDKYPESDCANKKQRMAELVKDKLYSTLPEALRTERHQLLTMPLADLVDKLYALFQLNTLFHQSAYICCFYDCLGEYLQDHVADISQFLVEWDEKLHEKTIQSDETDGLRIISIHKSKGLEFDTVIIPFCDWQLERNSIIWCEKKETPPFDQLPVIPIDFSRKNMKGTVYEEDYQEEHLQNIVDNMNLLYVAFTRAGKNLIITGKRMSEKRKKEKASLVISSNRSEVIEESLEQISKELEECRYETPSTDKDPILFEYGKLENILLQQEKTDDDQEETQNVFLSPALPVKIHIETHTSPVQFLQSNKSRDFVSGEDETPRDTRYIKLGNILHLLFSTIHTTNDINDKLRELEFDGILYDDEITEKDIREKLKKAFLNNHVKDWFSGRWKLYNECTILSKDEKGAMVECRPDRVMESDDEIIVVDFKFGKPHEGYKDQVQEYMRLLSQMSNKHVKGYLWYVLRHEIVNVERK